MGPLEYLKLIWAWKWPIFVVIAFLSGMWTENSRQEEKQIRAIATAVEHTQLENAKTIFRSIERSNKVETSIQSSNQRIDGIQAKVKPRIIYVPITIKEKVEANEQTGSCEADSAVPYLDSATVRLLNAARTELPTTEPPAGSDEESRTPSGTTVDTLIRNDLEVVKKYHDLARRHNELVDYVSKEVKNRAGQK